MIRSGYSFRKAYGHLPDVMSRIKETGWSCAPIADFNSTFAFTKWSKLAEKEGLRPIFGVELDVVESLGQKKPIADAWTFLAKDHLRPLHDLIGVATSNPGKAPSVTYAQALAALPGGLIAITGERVRLDAIKPMDDLYIGLSPATNKALFMKANRAGFVFIAKPDNLYPRASDKELYRLALGWRSTTQTYPQHIVSDAEWKASLNHFVPVGDLDEALENREAVFAMCQAELVQARLLVPPKPQTLKAMCEAGAATLFVNLKTEIYRERMERELALIKDKNFEDYFYIIANLMQWARQRMICGPARGSSCGSLVCYLLEITAIDPIPYGLLFERFLDITRTDWPDIDLDFDDARREQIFQYLEQKYGKAHVARLGTVGSFQYKSALNQVGTGLNVPKWEINKAAENVPFRSQGDESNDALKEFFQSSEGLNLEKCHPNIQLAQYLEGHPANASQHAAGVIITQGDVIDHVAVDRRTNSTMCDLKDAESINLLKIDALGLIQLSIFQRAFDLVDGQ